MIGKGFSVRGIVCRGYTFCWCDSGGVVNLLVLSFCRVGDVIVLELYVTVLVLLFCQVGDVTMLVLSFCHVGDVTVLVLSFCQVGAVTVQVLPFCWCCHYVGVGVVTMLVSYICGCCHSVKLMLSLFCCCHSVDVVKVLVYSLCLYCQSAVVLLQISFF